MMDLVQGMGSCWFKRFDRFMRFSGFAGVVLVMVWSLAVPTLCAAQSVSMSDRDLLVKLRTDRGGRAEDVDALVRIANEAAAKGLPAARLTNKIREGLAKGADPKRIETVLRQMTAQLETADRLIREMDPASTGTEREAPLTLMADAIGGGVTENEVREIRRVGHPPGKPALTVDGLASAAKGLSFIKEARLSATEGTAVMAEAVRQGYRSHEVLALGREVKRREADYRAGRADLRMLRTAIARGDRPEQLFRDRPPAPVERPARPETPQRPKPPARPDRPATRDR